MQEDKFGKKGCGNNGILGGNCLAERAMQAQGEMSQNLAWNNSPYKMILIYILISMVGI